LLFFVSSASHQIASYYQLHGGKIAAVTVAVSKSLQAALVFVSSDLIYCPKHPWNYHRADVQVDQCFSTWKGLGLVGIVIGVLVYSFDGILWGCNPHEDMQYGNVARPLLAAMEEPQEEVNR